MVAKLPVDPPAGFVLHNSTFKYLHTGPLEAEATELVENCFVDVLLASPPDALVRLSPLISPSAYDKGFEALTCPFAMTMLS